MNQPPDLKALLEAVRERHDTLSDRLRRVARHLRNDPQDIAFEKLTVIAERSGVQPSTIVRFAQAFGFDGAAQMQRLVRGGLLADYGKSEQVETLPNRTKSDAADGSPDLLMESVEADAFAIGELGRTLSRQKFKTALDLLERAETVFVVGFGTSYTVAGYLSRLLAGARKRTVLVDGVAGLLVQQLGTMGGTDLLICLDLPPQRSGTAAVLDAAIGVGCPIMAIGQSIPVRVARDAEVVLTVPEPASRGLPSLAGSMCLARALAMKIAGQRTGQEMVEET